MMSLAVEKFEIELEHDIDEEYQYQPGQLLRGDVILHLRSPIDLHSVRVRVRGQSTVSWEDNSGIMRDERHPNGIVEWIKRRHQSSETYIDVEKDVLRLSDAASGVSAESKTFGPGEHRFHLEFLLPSTLPSSFIGKFGCITYVVMATLRQSKHSTATHLIISEPFLVLRHTRLTDHPELLTPTEAVIERRLFSGGGGKAGRALCCCCLLCGSEIQIRFLLDKTGFLPDEDMVIYAEVTNRTSLTIDAFEAVLVLRSCFRAMNSVRENVQVIARERHVCLLGLEPQLSVQAIRLTIPPYVPESHLEGCDIIDIDYQVHLLVNLSDNRCLETSLPITVVTADDQRPAPSVQSPEEDRLSFDVLQIPEPTAEAISNNGIRNNGYLDDSGVHCSPSVGVMICDADDALEKFRHPMEPGETRRNIIFDDNEDEFCSSSL